MTPTSLIERPFFVYKVNSIVAVHGLNGTPRGTWTDKKSGRFWLEDFLPTALPTARIMTFGYDSRLAFSNSMAGVENFARDLLNRLRIVRASSEVLSPAPFHGR